MILMVLKFAAGYELCKKCEIPIVFVSKITNDEHKVNRVKKWLIEYCILIICVKKCKTDEVWSSVFTVEGLFLFEVLFDSLKSFVFLKKDIVLKW